MCEHAVHVALLPNAGMGHLIPFLRLADLLVRHSCRVTLITTKSTVSLAESELLSRFESSFPQINRVDFDLLPFDPTTANSNDPFWLRWESVRRSAHLLIPVLSSISPPLSAFVYGMTLISPMIPVTEALCLQSYILFTSSARMFSFYSYFPSVADGATSASDVLEIPGISPVPTTSIPPLLLVPNSLFAKIFTEDGRKLRKLNGVLVNTFEELEAESIEALKLRDGLPPVFALGPFMPCEFEKLKSNDGDADSPLKWLNGQPQDSVVYVCFGSRTAMKREQIREMGDGLLKSGCRFLWVVKVKIVDSEEEEELEKVVGEELMNGLKEKGLVVKTWVDQKAILDHPSIGGFVSHCGWNSVSEAAWYGVRVLAWPQHGDQKINAEVVERSGLGMWQKDWGWGGEQMVKGEEIGKANKKIMSTESLKNSALCVKEAARKAVSVGGSCEINFERLIEEWKDKDRNI
ncbi:hypothetical protein L6164_002172 [Bauhinia variegata]|uniref:Uncharacterized protein n=1 Tax=Bauhinia variegata TaxID=167791 RepID=A0ACB9PZH3_BAUVA|nr:hypothetical protein L6164_002172 [Bauhinia variegata]